MSDYSDRRKEFRKNVLTFILAYDLEGERLLVHQGVNKC